MKNIKSIISVIIIFFSLSTCSSSDVANRVSNKEICKINEEQKLYELAVVWKELSYNFDNMDNCSGLDIDSLYLSFIPIIQNTKNDFDYFREIQRFMAHFNNGHTDIVAVPNSLYDYLARPYIKTIYNNGQVLIENIGKQYSNDIQIGDEITYINGMEALEYFNQCYIPYLSVSNEKDKIHKAMFNGGPAHLLMKGTKLTLTIKSQNKVKKVDVFADKGIPSNNSKEDDWLIADNIRPDSIQIIVDSANSFMYVHLRRCNAAFYSFFSENKDLINKYDNLIINLSDNLGGMFNFEESLHFLFNKDSISAYNLFTKTNRAAYKAWGQSFCSNNNLKNTPYQFYCDYYYGKYFEPITRGSFENKVSSTQRYKGNIYIIINSNTFSAAEGIAIAFSQLDKVTILGKKTAGAIGNPLRITLPSGLAVRINTHKTYDYQGNDVSSGFSPHYEYDFSEFYKTESPNEMLSKFVNVIQGLEVKRKN